MNGDFFSEEEVLSMLGGLQKKYVQDRKKFYRLNSGDVVVIRNNSKTASYYWYGIQRELLRSDVQYVVCVAGYEGVYKIPMSIITEYAEEGLISVTKDGREYKLVLQRYFDKMCLRLKGSAKPVVIEQFQVCQ